MKSKNLILFLIILTFIISCQKNDNSLSTSRDSERISYPVTEYTVENDIVWFRDLESFNNILSHLHTYNRDSLINWEIENDFFYSYRKILDSEPDNDAVSDNSKPERLIIEDPVFATLVNQDGIIKIGSFIYKMTYDHVIKIPINSVKNDYFNDSEFKDIKDSDAVEVFDIERKVFNTTAKSVTGKNSVFKPHPLDSDLKAELEGWCVNYLFYGSIGVRITGWKNDGGWRTDRMVYAKVDGCAWGGPSWSPPVEYCDSNYGYNEKKVAKTLLWYTGIVYCDSIRCTYTYKDGGYPNIYQWIELWD
ncbi:MAG: hypothetical protein K9J25_03610 [Bacteroidales bacterium]|nr:hypothetical protein [Bacteroidales bacterium]